MQVANYNWLVDCDHMCHCDIVHRLSWEKFVSVMWT